MSELLRGGELLIDGFEEDEVSLSFTHWTIDYYTGFGLPDFRLEAAPYYGELGPERVAPMELAITLPNGDAWYGMFFHDDLDETLRLVVGSGGMTRVAKNAEHGG